MNAVALVTLGTSADVEAPALAKDLGLTAYEAGQRVRGALPTLILRTPDFARAKDLAQKLVARDHDALAFDLGEVVATEAMHEVRAFRLEPDALVSLLPTGGEQRLPFASVLAVIRAAHQEKSQSVKTSRGREFSIGRAVLSGGVVVSRATTREARLESTARDGVAYVFRERGLPWLLKESRLKYDGLEQAKKPVRFENFDTLVRTVVERAPHAAFDQRLATLKGVPERLTSDFTGQNTGSTTAGTIDVLAHVLFRALVGPT